MVLFHTHSLILDSSSSSRRAMRSKQCSLLFATALLLPLAAAAEPVRYYDCRNADGSMTYRIFPCDKGQQEVRRGSGGPGAMVDMRGMVPEPPAPKPQAAPQPDAQQLRAAGEDAYRMGRFTLAMDAYRKAAEAGDAQAQFELAAMYEKGEGAAQDYRQAAAWYRKAAEQDYAPAQFALGVMHDVGQGQAQDYGQALLWYGKAAERGEAKAQNNLGFMYSQGKGVEQDYVTAHMWFNISGVRGYEEGRRNREFVEKLMTPEQVAEAQRRAGEWLAAPP